MLNLVKMAEIPLCYQVLTSSAYLADAQPLSHESHCNFTVLLCDLRLQIQPTAVNHGGVTIGCHKIDNYDITTRA
ncbi:hypothetical protein OUZ56_033547 [Daphnia magna]|uniref:Uncharacterized protein n=1 Tax=Daphnia magna TaxID=35525 RepID=A0ABQ9ZYL5_9CRUS|nr:hypothetical protein OUZ56_033541 [Daphnia magna]KAK4017770.1 hypothetical protein OUZ56_033547 [Daphnia magna]